jgi:aspartate/methionine/tyrosine aminotransferase
MFRQFYRHSKILREPARHEHFILSGGVNLFPLSAVWKELIRLEIEANLAYGWYTPKEGFPTLQHAIGMWLNSLASAGQFPREKPLGGHVRLTLGASQAASMVFDFVAHTRTERKVLLLGHNYSLFERLARHYGLQIRELLGEEFQEAGSLPPPGAVLTALRQWRPDLLLLVIPNNPSGELYSTEDLARILAVAQETGTLVLLDQVGQLPIAQDCSTHIEATVVRTQTQDNVVWINSFSKSDGIPGFRLGYLMAPERIARHAAYCQLHCMTNPPTFPILPVFFALVCRCVHTGTREGWMDSHRRARLLLFARRMFEVTTAVAPRIVLDEVCHRLSPEGFARHYEQYESHQQAVGHAIHENYHHLFDGLGRYISGSTRLQGGFNFLVELAPFEGKDEDEVCDRLFTATSVGILTESCFRVSRRTRKNFWIRVSLASPTLKFRNAVGRLTNFLKTC